MSEASEHIEYHRAGSVRARGPQIDGVQEGYWEWFRLDGTKMRSGNFTHGEQTGEWITYNSEGLPHRVTQKTPKNP
ncbi:hypothetical protein D6T64_08790 [Cryobacterium melibiosiphilum]|uniref:MORN repeat variant n=1 Tax=Cryobacterium melibiosiphilum TaxID=995039 RepID=A0A3A5MJ56_9MICO|nr:hypothetical protein [Cryobacterium melibiosiphilum]RJT88931.1 hypothetical protein D6T64_08790 [Cryobacterium melibiosiphilum]